MSTSPDEVPWDGSIVVVEGVRYRSDELPDENAPAEAVEWVEALHPTARRRDRSTFFGFMEEQRSWP